MKQVRLGRTGLQVSEICLGMMSYGDPAWRDWVLARTPPTRSCGAPSRPGSRFFDTADVYSLGASETVTGRLLSKYSPTATTTCWPPRCSAR